MTAENVVLLRTAPRIDHARAERAVTELLAALGYPVEGEHRAMTPQRVASAFAEMLTPSAFLPTTFGNDEGYDELVVAREVPFRSLCEHHLLPFYGYAHVGYLPGGRIVGLSKLARVVEHFAAGLPVEVWPDLASRPLLVTVRDAEEGGRRLLHVMERQQLFLSHLRFASFVDIE